MSLQALRKSSAAAVLAALAGLSVALTGCAAGEPQAAASVPAAPPSSATATPPAETPPAAKATTQPAAPQFDDRLTLGNSTIKAGSAVRVYGGTLNPGTEVKVYGAQLMAPPSFDAASNMYVQVGDEVRLTETVTAVADAKGNYDLQLPIPAGTPAQPINVVMLSSDGRGDLVRGTVE